MLVKWSNYTTICFSFSINTISFKMMIYVCECLSLCGNMCAEVCAHTYAWGGSQKRVMEPPGAFVEYLPCYIGAMV